MTFWNNVHFAYSLSNTDFSAFKNLLVVVIQNYYSLRFSISDFCKFETK